MKWWPLVWRVDMEREVARAIQTNEMFVSDRTLAEDRLKRTEAALAFEQNRNAGLVDRLLSLKMAGAVEPPKVIMLAHPDCTSCGGSGVDDHDRPCGNCARALRPAADELRDLIESRAAGNLRVRGMMLRQLERDRADKVDPDTIRQRIESGVESSGVPT